jgi:hypothetical protein
MNLKNIVEIFSKLIVIKYYFVSEEYFKIKGFKEH